MNGILVDCGSIERLAAEIYQRLAAQTTFSETVRKTFARLAADEVEHAAQLDLAQKFPESSAAMVKRISGEKISEALAEIKRISHDLPQYIHSEEDALKMAIDLENSFVRIHLDNAFYFTDTRYSKLFDNLGRGDAAHLESLKECLRWWHDQQPN